MSKVCALPKPNHFPLKAEVTKKESSNFNYESERLNTFAGFPDKNLDTALLARTGFYFDSDKQEVKCNFCKHILQNIKSNDDIVRLHYKYSRHCKLMTRRKTANVPLNATKLDLDLPPLVYDECGTGHRYTNASPIYREVKYPQFSKMEDRLSSYKEWPVQMEQKPEELAAAGLFYTQEGDKVKCYYCALGLREWEKDDIPWIEHIKYSKDCYFVNFVKGNHFAELVHTKKATEQKEFRSQEELDILYTDNNCKNCNKGIAEVTFIPCNHTALCATCAISMNECLVCKRSVECRMRLYYY